MNWAANPSLFQRVMLVPGNPAVIWNTSGESSGASGKTCDFLCFSNGFAHARFVGPPVPVGWKRIQNPKRSRSRWPHGICWVAGFARNACFYKVFERFLGNPDRDSVPSDPLPHIPRRHPKSAKETFVFLCFSNGFRRAPWQITGIRVVHSGPRSAPLDLLGSGFSQKCMNFHCFERLLGNPDRRPAAPAWGAWATC